VADRAAGAGIDVRVLPSAAFADLARGRPFQGIAARVAPFSYADLDVLLAGVAGRPGAFLVALDQVQDPQNLGSILRSAAFFGASGVVVPQDRSAQVTPAVIRASAGGAARVPVARVVNLARALRACVDAGVVPVGAVAQGGVAPSEVPLDAPVVLVMGSEADGLRRLVRETCAVLVTIPSPGGFESLNVGVAAGVLMHALAAGAAKGGGLVP
jgi:23S rRNA (guanosine2251-2'-O)-methyltransferase